MSDVRRQFSKEFKEQALALMESSGKSVRDLAEELGVRTDQLYRWKRSKESDRSQAFRGNGKAREDELAAARKEIARLREERDILRKAIAIFSDRK